MKSTSPQTLPSLIPTTIPSKLSPNSTVNTKVTKNVRQRKSLPPALAPLSSPLPPHADKKDNKDNANDIFKHIKLPEGWLECPLNFDIPIQDYRILVCKTPIDGDIAKYLKIPKNKYFLPHQIYTLPNKSNNNNIKKKIGLVIDLTNQMFYDEISFNNNKKTNKQKVIRRVITMNDLNAPSNAETSGFIGLLKSYLNSIQNKNKWVIIHDHLGYNLTGFMLSAFMVKELNYSVDAAVYQFSNGRKPGIFEQKYIKLLHQMYSDKEDLDIFESTLKYKPLLKPSWMSMNSKKKTIKISNNNNNNTFKAPVTRIKRKRHLMEQSQPRGRGVPSSLLSDETGTTGNHHANHNNNNNKVDGNKMNDNDNDSMLIVEPPLKKQKLLASSVEVIVPPELKKDHPYLSAVRDSYLQSLTSIALQLSKTKDIFQSIQSRAPLIQLSSLNSLSKLYRISWLAHGYRLWLMILESGSFFIDPSFFICGKLGGIYYIEGCIFKNLKLNKKIDGTLCSGELVIDIIKNGNNIKKVPRFLINDLLVINKQSLYKFPHTERIKRAQDLLYKPCINSLKNSKLRIRVKPMYPIDDNIVNKLTKMIQNELPHKCDGLGLFPIDAPFGKRILRLNI